MSCAQTFEELYSELNSMSTQDIKNALEEASKNLEKCTEPFTAQDIIAHQQETIKQQQETIKRQYAKIERLKFLIQATLDVTPDLRAKLEALEDQEKRAHQYCKNVCEPRYKAEIEKLEKQKNTFAKRFYKEGVKDFAESLKAKNKKPECPWEDYSICESDIDETYEELVGGRK